MEMYKKALEFMEKNYGDTDEYFSVIGKGRNNRIIELVGGEI